MLEMLGFTDRQIHAMFIVAIFFAAAIVLFAIQGYFESKEFHKYDARHKAPKKKYKDDLTDVADAVFRQVIQ